MRKILLGARWSRQSSSSGSGRELLWRGSQASHQQCLLSSDRNTQNSQRTQRIVREHPEQSEDPCWDTCLRRTRCKILLSVPSILRTTALKGLSHSWGPPQYTVLQRLFLGTIGSPPQKKRWVDDNPNCETYLHHIETNLTATKTYHLALAF